MSNFSKFKVGDLVETTYGIRGKVINVKKTDTSFDIRVEVAATKIELVFDQINLKFYAPEKEKKLSFEDIGDTCPVCSTKFTVTKFGANSWKDCIPCGKKAEDISTTKVSNAFKNWGSL